MKRRLGLAAAAVVMVALAACGGGSGGGSTGGSGGGGGPEVQITPSYTQFRAVDVCKEIPQEKVEELVGKEVSRPAETYSVEGRDVACLYPFGRRDSKPVFIYISLGPTLMYQFNREIKHEMLPDVELGDEAMTLTLADHQQLWILLNGRATVLVGMVDFDLEQAKSLAEMGIEIAPEE